MIYWNDNAKAAVREFADYIGRIDFCERYLASVATKKTVADAVEVFDRKWPEYMAQGGCADAIVYEPCSKSWFVMSEAWSGGVDWYEVCTRAEFEAYVKEQDKPHFKATRENLEKIAKDAQGDFVEVEQEGEKWTHVDRDICECRVISTEGNLSWIQYKEGAHHVVPSAHLKTIKPTISEVEAWRLVSERDMTPNEVKEKYDII